MWDVEVGFEDDAHLQYKYFVHVEESKKITWEKISNRYAFILFSFSLFFALLFLVCSDVMLREDGASFEDEWDLIAAH